MSLKQMLACTHQVTESKNSYCGDSEESIEIVRKIRSTRAPKGMSQIMEAASTLGKESRKGQTKKSKETSSLPNVNIKDYFAIAKNVNGFKTNNKPKRKRNWDSSSSSENENYNTKCSRPTNVSSNTSEKVNIESKQVEQKLTSNIVKSTVNVEILKPSTKNVSGTKKLTILDVIRKLKNENADKCSNSEKETTFESRTQNSSKPTIYNVLQMLKQNAATKPSPKRNVYVSKKSPLRVATKNKFIAAVQLLCNAEPTQKVEVSNIDQQHNSEERLDFLRLQTGAHLTDENINNLNMPDKNIKRINTRWYSKEIEVRDTDNINNIYLKPKDSVIVEQMDIKNVFESKNSTFSERVRTSDNYLEIPDSAKAEVTPDIQDKENSSHESRLKLLNLLKVLRSYQNETIINNENGLRKYSTTGSICGKNFVKSTKDGYSMPVTKTEAFSARRKIVARTEKSSNRKIAKKMPKKVTTSKKSKLQVTAPTTPFSCTLTSQRKIVEDSKSKKSPKDNAPISNNSESNSENSFDFLTLLPHDGNLSESNKLTNEADECSTENKQNKSHKNLKQVKGVSALENVNDTLEVLPFQNKIIDNQQQHSELSDIVNVPSKTINSKEKSSQKINILSNTILPNCPSKKSKDLLTNTIDITNKFFLPKIDNLPKDYISIDDEKNETVGNDTPIFSTNSGKAKDSQNKLNTTEESENLLEDKTLRSILSRNYEKLKRQVKSQSVLDVLKNATNKQAAVKTIKRFRKGRTKIYRLKKLKRTVAEQPVSSQPNLNFDDVFKHLMQNYDSPAFPRSKSASSVSTSSSYVTDDAKSDTFSTGSRELSSPQQRLRKGFNEICSDKTLLNDETDYDDVMEYSKDEIKVKIQNIFFRIFEDLSTGRKSFLRIRRQNLENCVVKEGRLQFKPEQEILMTVISSGAKRSQTRFKLILYVMKKILDLLETNTKLTKRELYYQFKNLISDQGAMDRAINSVSCLLDVGTWALNIIAQKGLVFGNMKILMASGETLNCNIPGTLIPQDSEIVEIQSTAYFILVVEKEAIFHKLLEEDLPNKLTRPFIMITGKGFPDLNTQLFLRKLWIIMSIPVFILVDADPHGVNIMLNYRYGSVNNAHVSHHLAVPNAKWLGVYPSEILHLNLTREPLSSREVRMVEQLLKSPYMEGNPRLVNELNVLLEKKYKAGIEGLIKSNIFLSEAYLPNKFYSHDFI